ncbi:bacteriochlorophyll/chlorophyll a synthase [compost metagenome]
MQLTSLPVIERLGTGKLTSRPGSDTSKASRPFASTREILVQTRLATPEGLRQLAWKDALTLMRPQQWFLPMGAMLAGSLAAGCGDHLMATLPQLLMGLVLVGPLLAGSSNVINAYFDRDLEAPGGPLSSGRMTPDLAVAQIAVMALLALGVANLLGPWIFALAIASLFISLAVNAPPLRLRRQTWWNGLFHGVAAIAFPWVIGHLPHGALTVNSGILAGLFAFGAMGLQIMAGLTDADREREAGIRSFAALLGPELGALVSALLVNTAILGAAILCYDGNALAASGALSVLFAVTLAVQSSLLWRGTLRDRWPVAVVHGFYGLSMIIAGAAIATVTTSF